AALTQRLHDAGHLAGSLPDGAVDADHVAAALIQDRVDGDGRLARTAVADDQLALATADRDHGVDGLEPRLERLLHRLPQHDAGRDHVDETAPLNGIDRTLPVDRLAERVDHATQVPRADRHVQHAAGPPDRVALVQDRPVAHDDG